MRNQFNYFELKRKVIYQRVQDSSPDKFEYRLKPRKHYMEYRPTYNDEGWRPVWNIDFYDEHKSSYTVKDITR